MSNDGISHLDFEFEISNWKSLLNVYDFYTKCSIFTCLKYLRIERVCDAVYLVEETKFENSKKPR